MFFFTKKTVVGASRSLLAHPGSETLTLGAKRSPWERDAPPHYEFTLRRCSRIFYCQQLRIAINRIFLNLVDTLMKIKRNNLYCA